MTTESRKDIKFYILVFLAFGLAILGCLVPPVGQIESSMLWAVFAFLGLSACVEGIDLKGIIHEIRLLKEFKAEQSKNETELA